MDEIQRSSIVDKKASELYAKHKRLAGLLAEQALAKEQSLDDQDSTVGAVLQFKKPKRVSYTDLRSLERQYEVNLEHSRNLLKYHGGILYDIAVKEIKRLGIGFSMDIPDNVVKGNFTDKE